MHLSSADMTAVWTSAATALIVIVGLWVKWAIAPVTIAFGAGLIVGKILGRRERRDAKPVSPASWSNP